MPVLANPKHERFAQLIAAGGTDQADAYRATINDKVSGQTLYVNASRLAAKLRLRIEELQSKLDLTITEKVEVEAERIGLEWARIGFLDPKEMFDELGQLRHVKDMPAAVRAAISSVEIRRVKGPDGQSSSDEIIKLRFWNKNEALTGLAKWKRMLVDQVEHGKPGDFGLPREAREAKELLDRIRAEKSVPKALPPVVAPRKQDA